VRTLEPSVTIRRKLLGTLFASVGITRIGFLAATTVTTLVARETLHTATWTGLPSALSIVGMALATPVLSTFMARHGRRPGMVLGQAVALAGAVGAVVAADLGTFVLLAASLFVMGAGNGADRLARYAAAEVSPEERRGWAIALIVWAGTVGSVVGPALLEPARAWAESLGIDGLGGPYLVAAAAFGVAGFLLVVMLRPDPLDFVPGERRSSRGEERVPLGDLLRPVPVRTALAGLLAVQFVMVVVMTMTPLHIRGAGGSLGAVGVVIAAHTLGMFALSPVTGALTDRFGPLRVVLGGLATTAVAGVLAAFAGGSDRLVLVVALFLLGLGWNMGYVAGSAMVVADTEPRFRLQVQGVADAAIWGVAAAASLGSGWLLTWGGYRLVSLVGVAVAVVPLVGILVARRRASAPVG